MATAETQGSDGVFRTLVPSRLDRLPWVGFHTLVLVALGASWFINGLETQLFTQGGVVLQNEAAFGLTTAQVGLTATFYLVGQVVGALGFARLTDALGRRKLFFITLVVFMLGNVASGFAPTFEILLIFRFVSGMAIGGEQVAIVSAIDEMIPARYRARANIAIGATVWVGVMAGAAAGLLLYDSALLPVNVGWRIALFIGPVLCIPLLFLRRHIPESPRWLMTHGRGDEAESVTDAIENGIRDRGWELEPVPDEKALTLQQHPDRVGYLRSLRVMFVRYSKPSIAAFAVMTTQGFLYNAIFFTFALVLANFYGIAPSALSYYIFIFGAGNALGALLGKLFDTVGRRKMMLISYVGSGIVLGITGVLFELDVLNAITVTLLWWLSFFIASAGAGAAYVIASEVFPVEMRASALSVFYIASQGVGAVAPLIFAALIGDGKDRVPMMYGYLGAAILMIAGGVTMWIFGVDAHGRSLEDVAPPLSARPAIGGELRTEEP